MFRAGEIIVGYFNSECIRHAFLTKAYFELFGNCPEPEAIKQLTIKKTDNGK
jgi:hypothetical protein